MRIELTSADEGRSLRSGKPELWVRVLSDQPLAPADFQRKILPEVRDDVEGYSTIPVQFYSDLAGSWEDEPEEVSFAHEAWFILEKVGS